MKIIDSYFRLLGRLMDRASDYEDSGISLAALLFVIMATGTAVVVGSVYAIAYASEVSPWLAALVGFAIVFFIGYQLITRALYEAPKDTHGVEDDPEWSSR